MPMTFTFQARNRLELTLQENGVSIKESLYPDGDQEIFITADRIPEMIEFFQDAITTLKEAEG